MEGLDSAARFRQRYEVLLRLLSLPEADAASIGAFFDRVAATGLRVEELSRCSPAELTAGLGFSMQDAAAFVDASESAQRAIANLDANGVHLLTRADADWPANLLRDDARRATPWLFLLGDPDILSTPSVGIAGSRDATGGSIAITEKIASDLAGHGRVIVSGGARGIDTTAHDAALAAGGRTVVVLAQGIGTWQLPWRWREPLREGRLAVVSEYLPMEPWETSRALQRNGTIVQMGEAFVVIQAGAPSGSLSAGQHAIRMKWPIHAVRQDGHNAESFPGNEVLIRHGAMPLDVPVNGPLPQSAIDQILIARPVIRDLPAQLGLFS